MTTHVAAGPSPPAGGPGPRSATRRNVELLLLLLVSGIILALSVSVEAALDRSITLNSLYLPLGLGGIFLAAHVAVRFLAPYADPVILPCVALLNGLGVTFIGRLSLSETKDDYVGQGLRQWFWTVAAVLLFSAVLFFIRDHRSLSRFSYTAGLAGVVLVMIPAVLPAKFSTINGAKLWIIIPGVGQIQPGEFAKLALMVFFASYLVNKRDVLSLASKRVMGIDLPRGRDLGPVVAAWLASLMVLIFEKDLGTSLMFFGIFIVMLYIATERTSWLLIGLSLFALGAYSAYKFVGRVQDRVSIWLDPFEDRDAGFQLIESLFGLGTGGLFGTGPGAGQPESVPFASSDFIISTIGEETGLFGLGAVLMLYMVVAARGIRASLDVRDSFGKLLAGGLAFSLGLQVFVIVGGVTKLIPLTGLTTPFLSFGGSSLMANWCLVALLLRVSDAGRRPSAVSMPVQLQHAQTQVVRL